VQQDEIHPTPAGAKVLADLMIAKIKPHLIPNQGVKP
jgi:lysophospholipase L1-like esterase